MDATYVSATSFTIVGDQTAIFVTGRRIKANCGVDGYKYGAISAQAYSDPNTTVTLTAISDDLTANLSSVEWGVAISTIMPDIYDTIYIDAAAMIPCTTNGALQGTHEYGTNDIDLDYFAFDAGATEERVQFKLKMPEGWDRSTIKAKFDWSSDTGSTTADTVEWGIKAGALSDSDSIDAALGTPQVISDALLADNGADLQISAATPAITVGGTPALGDLIVFEIYRNTDGTDDMAEDAWLFGVTVQFNKTGQISAW